jgi:triacylglycerol lipase
MANGDPVVLCHGLFGWGPDELGGFPYWGIARSIQSTLPTHQASVGPISSVHDRACELAFQIRGGRVDYGEDHAAKEGHARFGRTYSPEQAFHSRWSESHPVHLVGHSMGAPTIWMLQHLLATDFFGWGSNAKWVRSVNSISGVLNGSTATYYQGANERTGLVDERSIGDYLARSIELHIRLTGDLFDRFYDFDLDHWGIESKGRPAMDAQLPRIVQSPMFRGKDNAAYCLTIQGMLEQTTLCKTHPGTHYFSYVTEQTYAGFLSGHHYPSPTMNPFAIATAVYMGQKTFDRPFYPDFKSADWWHNDGLVPVFSQLYPRISGDHEIGGEIGDQTRFAPGRWYYQILNEIDHMDIVGLPKFGLVGMQKEFYRSLFERLAAL